MSTPVYNNSPTCPAAISAAGAAALASSLSFQVAAPSQTVPLAYVPTYAIKDRARHEWTILDVTTPSGLLLPDYANIACPPLDKAQMQRLNEILEKSFAVDGKSECIDFGITTSILDYLKIVRKIGCSGFPVDEETSYAISFTDYYISGSETFRIVGADYLARQLLPAVLKKHLPTLSDHNLQLELTRLLPDTLMKLIDRRVNIRKPDIDVQCILDKDFPVQALGAFPDLYTTGLKHHLPTPFPVNLKQNILTELNRRFPDRGWSWLEHNEPLLKHYAIKNLAFNKLACPSGKTQFAIAGFGPRHGQAVEFISVLNLERKDGIFPSFKIPFFPHLHPQKAQNNIVPVGKNRVQALFDLMFGIARINADEADESDFKILLCRYTLFGDLFVCDTKTPDGTERLLLNCVYKAFQDSNNKISKKIKRKNNARQTSAVSTIGDYLYYLLQDAYKHHLFQNPGAAIALTFNTCSMLRELIPPQELDKLIGRMKKYWKNPMPPSHTLMQALGELLADSTMPFTQRASLIELCAFLSCQAPLQQTPDTSHTTVIPRLNDGIKPISQVSVPCGTFLFYLYADARSLRESLQGAVSFIQKCSDPKLRDAALRVVQGLIPKEPFHGSGSSQMMADLKHFNVPLQAYENTAMALLLKDEPLLLALGSFLYFAVQAMSTTPLSTKTILHAVPKLAKLWPQSCLEGSLARQKIHLSLTQLLRAPSEHKPRAWLATLARSPNLADDAYDLWREKFLKNETLSTQTKTETAHILFKAYAQQHNGLAFSILSHAVEHNLILEEEQFALLTLWLKNFPKDKLCHHLGRIDSLFDMLAKKGSPSNVIFAKKILQSLSLLPKNLLTPGMLTLQQRFHLEPDTKLNLKCPMPDIIPLDPLADYHKADTPLRLPNISSLPNAVPNVVMPTHLLLAFNLETLKEDGVSQPTATFDAVWTYLKHIEAQNSAPLQPRVHANAMQLLLKLALHPYYKQNPLPQSFKKMMRRCAQALYERFKENDPISYCALFAAHKALQIDTISSSETQVLQRAFYLNKNVALFKMILETLGSSSEVKKSKRWPLLLTTFACTTNNPNDMTIALSKRDALVQPKNHEECDLFFSRLERLIQDSNFDMALRLLPSIQLPETPDPKWETIFFRLLHALAEKQQWDLSLDALRLCPFSPKNMNNVDEYSHLLRRSVRSTQDSSQDRLLHIIHLLKRFNIGTVSIWQQCIHQAAANPRRDIIDVLWDHLKQVFRAPRRVESNNATIREMWIAFLPLLKIGSPEILKSLLDDDTPIVDLCNKLMLPEHHAKVFALLSEGWIHLLRRSASTELSKRTDTFIMRYDQWMARLQVHALQLSDRLRFNLQFSDALSSSTNPEHLLKATQNMIHLASISSWEGCSRDEQEAYHDALIQLVKHIATLKSVPANFSDELVKLSKVARNTSVPTWTLLCLIASLLGCNNPESLSEGLAVLSSFLQDSKEIPADVGARMTQYMAFNLFKKALSTKSPEMLVQCGKLLHLQRLSLLLNRKQRAELAGETVQQAAKYALERDTTEQNALSELEFANTLYEQCYPYFESDPAEEKTCSTLYAAVLVRMAVVHGQLPRIEETIDKLRQQVRPGESNARLERFICTLMQVGGQLILSLNTPDVPKEFIPLRGLAMAEIIQQECLKMFQPGNTHTEDQVSNLVDWITALVSRRTIKLPVASSPMQSHCCLNKSTAGAFSKFGTASLEHAEKCGIWKMHPQQALEVYLYVDRKMSGNVYKYWDAKQDPAVLSKVCKRYETNAEHSPQAEQIFQSLYTFFSELCDMKILINASETYYQCISTLYSIQLHLPKETQEPNLTKIEALVQALAGAFELPPEFKVTILSIKLDHIYKFFMSAVAKMAYYEIAHDQIVAISRYTPLSPQTGKDLVNKQLQFLAALRNTLPNTPQSVGELSFGDWRTTESIRDAYVNLLFNNNLLYQGQEEKFLQELEWVLPHVKNSIFALHTTPTTTLTARNGFRLSERTLALCIPNILCVTVMQTAAKPIQTKREDLLVHWIKMLADMYSAIGGDFSLCTDVLDYSIAHKLFLPTTLKGKPCESPKIRDLRTYMGKKKQTLSRKR